MFFSGWIESDVRWGLTDLAFEKPVASPSPAKREARSESEDFWVLSESLQSLVPKLSELRLLGTEAEAGGRPIRRRRFGDGCAGFLGFGSKRNGESAVMNKRLVSCGVVRV